MYSLHNQTVPSRWNGSSIAIRVRIFIHNIQNSATVWWGFDGYYVLNHHGISWFSYNPAKGVTESMVLLKALWEKEKTQLLVVFSN